jgi:uncharacterized membrane protein YraQ (UPF0718 family)
MSNCCAPPEKPSKQEISSCCGQAESTGGQGARKAHFDYLLWVSFGLAAILYASYGLNLNPGVEWFEHLGHGVFDLLNTMWWGVVIGALFVGVLSRIPQALILSVLGRGGSINGIVRAAFAGVLLDLCSHGILMVGMKLYQKGASAGQVMAFLISSPWNSFSLTIILIALIGLPWTLAFIGLSMVIALITGYLFDHLIGKGVLPANPHTDTATFDGEYKFWPEAAKQWRGINWSFKLVGEILWDGFKGSRTVLRWLLFGVLLAALIRTFVSLDMFQTWFGPSVLGLVFTLIAATVIEVCSEGSTPIAADLVTRAQAPGNGFAFMMAGVATDYTEIMVLKDTTRSWKLTLFLPLLTLPQVVVVALVLNGMHF